MKQPKLSKLTMGQLKAYKKISNTAKKKYWQSRIDELGRKAEYKKWLKSQ